MTFQDFIVTPIWFFLLLLGAFIVRPMVTNRETRRYFIPGLMVKFVGAIALGLIYQFYYGGGDTFTFHTHGSRWIWKAFMDNPVTGIEILFQKPGDYNGETFKFTQHIWMFRDRASMFVIKATSLIDLLTFNTYSATALFFSAFAFSGHWALFSVFQKLYPLHTRSLAVATLFIPSVVFWGSGILKDTITLSALCWLTYAMLRITLFNKLNQTNIFLVLVMGWVVYSIKIYILLCFVAAASLFLYSRYISVIKNAAIKITIAPLLIIIFIGGGYYAMNKIAEDDSRYALDKIAETAMITAYDIRYGWGARQGDNSGYTLGELDGSIGSLIRLAPAGIIVTLFRPWLWEVKNPLMLISAIESFTFLMLTLWAAFNVPWQRLLKKLNHPVIKFCLVFSLMFAFAVGVSTFNFGTLMRYKIPVMPFYSLFLVCISKSHSIQAMK